MRKDNLEPCSRPSSETPVKYSNPVHNAKSLIVMFVSCNYISLIKSGRQRLTGAESDVVVSVRQCSASVALTVAWERSVGSRLVVADPIVGCCIVDVVSVSIDSVA